MDECVFEMNISEDRHRNGFGNVLQYLITVFMYYINPSLQLRERALSVEQENMSRCDAAQLFI